MQRIQTLPHPVKNMPFNLQQAIDLLNGDEPFTWPRLRRRQLLPTVDEVAKAVKTKP